MLKIKLYTNNIKWEKLPERVEAIRQTLLSGACAYKYIYGDIAIDIEEVSVNLVYNGGFLDEAWFQKTFSGKEYQGYGLLIDRKDWKGQENLLGKYIVGEKLNFYIISGEKEKVRRSDGKRYVVFEEVFEHEVAHAVYHDLECPLKWAWLDTYFFKGFDNTHYFWENKHDTIGMRDDMMTFWEEKSKTILNQIKKLQDKLGSISLTGLKPLVQRKYNELERLCREAGLPIRMTEGYRSKERQAMLYAQGRTTAGNIVTNAKAGQSMHNFAVAFDVVPLKGYNISKLDWITIGELGESIGLKWGGRFIGLEDFPHFQMVFEYTLADFQQDRIDWTRYI
jgi:peptidoglycan LD-endopeptidase CwlK